MKWEDIDLSELPEHTKFLEKMESQKYIWAMYEPTTIEKDYPFGQDWWKYVYWIPKIKNEFYFVALSSPDFHGGIIKLCDKYGIDHWYFNTYYSSFFKRLEWMRRNGTNHIGEVKNGRR